MPASSKSTFLIIYSELSTSSHDALGPAQGRYREVLPENTSPEMIISCEVWGLPCLGNVKAGEIANWCHKWWVGANRCFFSSGFLPSCFWLYWLSQYAKVHRRGMGMRYSEAFRAKITQGWHTKQGALSIGLNPPCEHRHLLRLGCQVPRKCSLPLPEVCALLRLDETSSRTNRVNRH